jgi:rod shape-determining protein MreD
MIHRFIPQVDGLHFGDVVPVVVTFVLIMLNAVVFSVLGMTSIAPNIALMSVMYWAVHRPDLLPSWTVLLLGLLYDSFTGSLLGLHAGFLVLAHRVLVLQYHIFQGKDFIMSHMGFSLLQVVVAVGSWGLVSAIYGIWLPFIPVALHALLGIALFPWFFMLLQWVNAMLIMKREDF